MIRDKELSIIIFKFNRQSSIFKRLELVCVVYTLSLRSYSKKEKFNNSTKRKI